MDQTVTVESETEAGEEEYIVMTLTERNVCRQ